MEVLSRRRLTAALAARQLLIERERLGPAEAIRRLTPLQAQHPTAPYYGLAARLDGFTRADLEAAIGARDVVKTTISRLTLHLVAGADYPAYAQLTRQTRMRKWRKDYAHLDEARVTARAGGLAADAALERRDPRPGPPLRGRPRRDLRADLLRPDAAAARAAPARAATGTTAAGRAS